MKVLLTGAAGQLGHALRKQVPAGVELIASSRGGGDGLLALDLADASACSAAVHQHRPDWVLNGGAYTAVDKAESEPELAHAVNGGAPRAFAEALAETGGRMLQVSTDFVFNGAQGHPYRPEQPRDPLGIYGASKAAGEEAVKHVLGPSGRGLILRTSWVMGPVGKNFALTMLRLHRDKPEIGVVADQVGCPTSTHTLAAACWRAIERASREAGAVSPIMDWSDTGDASWYDVAVPVDELSLELGVLEGMAELKPLTTADYPTPSQRPSYSLLDCPETRRVLELPGVPLAASAAAAAGGHGMSREPVSVQRKRVEHRHLRTADQAQLTLKVTTVVGEALELEGKSASIKSRSECIQFSNARSFSSCFSHICLAGSRHKFSIDKNKRKRDNYEPAPLRLERVGNGGE